MNYSRPVMVIGLSACLFLVPLAHAGAPQEARGVPDAGLVKQCIADMGVNSDIVLKLKSGKRTRGLIRNIQPERFDLIRPRKESLKVVTYGDVAALSPAGTPALAHDSACAVMTARWPAKRSKFRWHDLQRFQPGQNIRVIRVIRANRKKVTGRFLFSTEEAVILRVKKRDLIIPREQVQRVRREKSHRARNVLGTWGVAVGAVFASLLAHHFDSDSRSD